MQVSPVSFSSKQLVGDRIITKTANQFRSTKTVSDLSGNLIWGTAKYKNGDTITVQRGMLDQMAAYCELDGGARKIKTDLPESLRSNKVPAIKDVLAFGDKIKNLILKYNPEGCSKCV